MNDASLSARPLMFWLERSKCADAEHDASFRVSSTMNRLTQFPVEHTESQWRWYEGTQTLCCCANASPGRLSGEKRC